MWAALLIPNRPKKLDIGARVNEASLVPGAAITASNPPGEQQVVAVKQTMTIDSTLPEWKRRMIEKNEAAKKEVTDIMDDSLRRVMAKTELKPENQRGQAVDSYVSAVDWIMWSVNSVISRVK